MNADSRRYIAGNPWQAAAARGAETCLQRGAGEPARIPVL